MNEAATAAANDPPRAEVLLSGAEAETVLRRLCQHHALISARREGSSRNYLSVVLAVDGDNGDMLFDALQPNPVLPLLLGESLKCRSQLDGAEVYFEASVSGSEDFESQPALRMRLPAQVRVRERRAVHRLSVPATTRRPQAVAAVGDNKLVLQVVDLSLHGAGATTSRTAAAASGVAVGDVIEIDLELPGAQILALAEVRTRAVHGDKLRLGLRFTELEPRELDRLAAAVLRLERQLIREHRGR